METVVEEFAVTVFPIADLDGWLQFTESIDKGKRAEAHRSFLRRLGVKREHAHHVPSPMGDLAVLVWEGVDQDKIPELMGLDARRPAIRTRALPGDLRRAGAARGRRKCRPASLGAPGRHDRTLTHEVSQLVVSVRSIGPWARSCSSSSLNRRSMSPAVVGPARPTFSA